MPIRFVFLPFKGAFEFALIPAADTGPSNGILAESSEFLIAESGEFIIQES